MSSGEKAKSPATFEERNPFDISKRPGKDVAAEIAQRLAAWKQARARSYVAPTTVPVPEAKLPPQAKATPKAPAIGAPVQPPRLPKAAQSSPQQRGDTPTSRRVPGSDASGISTARAPFFASFSAVKRAMPAAPSLKDSVASLDQAIETQVVKAPMTEAVSVDVAATETPAFDSPVAESLDTEAAASSSETREIATAAVEGPVADAVAPALTLEPVDEPRSDTINAYETDLPRVAEPLAREQAVEYPAPSPSELVVAPSDTHEVDAPTAEAPIAEVHAAEAVTPTMPPIEALETATHESLDVPEADPTNPVETVQAEAEVNLLDVPVSAPFEAAVPDLPVRESVIPDIRVHDDGDTYAPVTPPSEAAATAEPPIESPDIERDRSAAREIKAKWMRAHELDELATEMAAAKERQTKPAAPVAPAVEEPAIEEPATESPRVEAPLNAEPLEALPEIETPIPAVATFPEADEFARIEPTFDRPMTHEPEPSAPSSEPEAAADNSSTTALRGIALPSIETRIERRRFSTLRVEPQLAVRHPLFPEIEPEEWDVPPAVAARAKREPRGGTGWAIGLGAVLLLVGVTAPAAIWQGQRSAQIDQVAILTPAPTPLANATSQGTLPEPPQPAATPSPSPAQPATAEQAPTNQASLAAVQDGGEVAATPIFKPPLPQLEAANKPAAKSDNVAVDAPVPFPPVARPFVPEAQPGPFLTPPSNGAQTASVALRPNLMAQLKPKAPAGMLSAPVAKPATAARKVVQKPKSQSPQTLDQMFQTLIDTLSEGQPVNSANKPVPPSTRR